VHAQQWRVAGGFEAKYRRYKSLIDNRLRLFVKQDTPRTVYEPAKYILSGGGKRIRPTLVLLACEAVGGDSQDALDAAVAVEILHNFTLVHDDIMDNADFRRGRQTVHKRWDTDTAILVGDALLGMAYKSLLKTRKKSIHEIMNVFTDGLIEVCEGQGYDKEFETKNSLRMEQYLAMIEKKTGKLIAMSAEIGAMIGGGNKQKRAALRKYGWHLGRAFQIQDDLLDIVADAKAFGKTIGGDIIAGKKTYLLVRALRWVKGKDQALIRNVVRHHAVAKRRISEVKRMYERYGIIKAANADIQRDIEKAVGALRPIGSRQIREQLVWFSNMVLNRRY
jgi:geranylgeranyl diphosphate synthase type II